MDENDRKTNDVKQKDRQVMLAKKMAMAQRPDTKVVTTRTPESHVLYLILVQADIAISTLKTRLFQDGYSADEVTQLIEDFYDKCKALDGSVKKISKKCGFTYKSAKELHE